MGISKTVRNGLFEVVMVILAVIFIPPVWIVLTNSFKPLGEILRNTFGLPSELYFGSFLYVLENMNYARIFLNTLCICVFAISITVVLSTMCAYRLSRWNNKISNAILLLLMASMTVPFQSIMLPFAKIYERLHLTDSIPGLILVLVPHFCRMCIGLARITPLTAL